MENNKIDYQLAKIIYHKMLSVMKFTLNLEEQKYPERGREDDRYKFFKKQLMSNTYNSIRDLLDQLSSIKLLEQSDPPEDLKNGYKQTPGGGSGYVNAKSFHTWITKANAKKGEVAKEE